MGRCSDNGGDGDGDGGDDGSSDGYGRCDCSGNKSKHDGDGDCDDGGDDGGGDGGDDGGGDGGDDGGGDGGVDGSGNGGDDGGGDGGNTKPPIELPTSPFPSHPTFMRVLRKTSNFSWLSLLHVAPSDHVRAKKKANCVYEFFVHSSIYFSFIHPFNYLFFHSSI